MGSMYDDTPTSRFEEDMRAIIDGTPWPERPPKSKMEELLEELNDLIKAGGGGGGTSTIAWKPSVASDGTISWTRTASETKPDDQNIKGPKGEDGQDGEDGLGIKQVSINLENHLIITYDDDTTEDAGALPGGGSTTLADLTDTVITSPTNGQVLTYNSTTGKWENADGKTVKAFVKATPAMTSATTPSGVVSASSEYNGSYAAWYAFCGTPGNDQQTWATSYGQTIGEWIQYKFDEGVVIKKIATTNRNEGNPRVIKKFIFQGSNDGETYVDLANCEVESNQGHYRQEFLINNDTAYTYYRLYVTEPWVSGDTTVGLAQLEIYKEIEVEIKSLGDLVDVNIYNAAEGQALIYDAASSQWVNTKVLSASYGGTGNSSGYIRAGVRENTTIGNRATAEGVNNTVSGENAHAEGQNNTASGTHSHVEGEQCQATEWWAHAEGFQSKAYGRVTHAEGNGTTASNYYAHSEGLMSTASGNTSHAEGSGTTASGANSHSQNESTTASGARSTAAGYYTNAGYENQFVVGKYNNNKNTSLLEVGNGADAYHRSNALELDASGNLKVAGTITDGNGNVLEESPKVHILDTESTDVSSTTSIPLANISTFPTCEVGDIIVLKVNANYTFNTTAGGYWTFKINNIGYEMRLLWADESNFNQDLPKGSCVVFVYNHNMLFDDFLTVASFDVKNFDPSTVVQKSQTAGLLKNDGTVDTTTYASEADMEGLIGSTVGWTGKNQCPITEHSGSSSGLTFVADEDAGTITVNGTAPSNATTYLAFSRYLNLKAGTYKLTGCTGGSENTYYLSVFLGGGYYKGMDTGNGLTFTVGSDYTPGANDRVEVTVKANTVMDNVVFRPMILSSVISDTTFEPYHKPVNDWCVDKINNGVYDGISSVVGWTGKNLFDGERSYGGYVSPSQGGALVQDWVNITTNYFIPIKSGESIILSTDGNSNSLAISMYDDNETFVERDERTNLSTLTYTAAQNGKIRATVNGDSQTRTDEQRKAYILTKKIMLRSASITDSTYEPYHKSVEECLEEINDKLSYLEQSVTLSTSASTTVTFTDSSITANSFIEYACSQWDLVPESITGAAGSCTIVLPKVDSAQSVTVRIYVR